MHASLAPKFENNFLSIIIALYVYQLCMWMPGEMYKTATQSTELNVNWNKENNPCYLLRQ